MFNRRPKPHSGEMACNIQIFYIHLHRPTVPERSRVGRSAEACLSRGAGVSQLEAACSTPAKRAFHVWGTLSKRQKPHSINIKKTYSNEYIEKRVCIKTS